MPCGPDEVSIRSYTGPMTVLNTSTEEYINLEHTGLVCIHVLKTG